VTLDVLLCERSQVAEEKLAVLVPGLAQEVRVGSLLMRRAGLKTGILFCAVSPPAFSKK
jgi:hypothetical protein